MSRGAEHWLTGPDEVAESLGMDGVISAGVKNEDEGLYPGPARLLAARPCALQWPREHVDGELT